MRHLMSPLDFDLDELDKVLDLQMTLRKIRQSMHMRVMER